MTTALQKDALDMLDLNGPLNFAELQVACRIKRKQRGGFRSAINILFKRGLVDANEIEMWLTAAGVHEARKRAKALQRMPFTDDMNQMIDDLARSAT